MNVENIGKWHLPEIEGSHGPVVLYAENDFELVMMFATFFKFKGFQVRHVEDGQNVLDILENSDFTPDILLSDNHMNVVNGGDIISRVRELRPNLPIVMLSGESSQDEVDKFFADGANHFLRKPITPAELIRKLEEILQAQKEP